MIYRLKKPKIREFRNDTISGQVTHFLFYLFIKCWYISWPLIMILLGIIGLLISSALDNSQFALLSMISLAAGACSLFFILPNLNL